MTPYEINRIIEATDHEDNDNRAIRRMLRTLLIHEADVEASRKRANRGAALAGTDRQGE